MQQFASKLFERLWSAAQNSYINKATHYHKKRFPLQTFREAYIRLDNETVMVHKSALPADSGLILQDA